MLPTRNAGEEMRKIGRKLKISRNTEEELTAGSRGRGYRETTRESTPDGKGSGEIRPAHLTSPFSL